MTLAGMWATNACAVDPHEEASDDTDDTTAAVAQDLGAGACTAIKLSAPTKGFFAAVGAPVTLSAIATCPPGSTPEYQYWVKLAAAPNWQVLGPFVPGSSSWTPPSAGSWSVTAVTRAVGAPDNYQARANSAAGTVTGSANQAPIAGNDAITTSVNTPGSTNLLVNDSDPDADALSVASFTQGAHGSVAVASGTATYTPASGYVGSDSFTYALDDGHGGTATGTVAVTVSSAPGCTISAAGPATGVYGQNLHLTSTASCTSGTAEVQWFHRVNSAFVAVAPFSTTTSLDFTAAFVGADQFYARVRALGTTQIQGTSSTVTINVADNTPQCTQVKLLTPTINQTLPNGAAQTLTASATCPAGAVPEFQFWVKPAGATNWQILPPYTTGSGSWTPMATGAWSLKAVTRTVGSHVNYQISSAQVGVTIITAPVCGDGVQDAGEECDDGNTADGDGCGHSCRIERCGDGLIQLANGESCDDGNTTNGDGCDATCHTEPFQTTPPVQVSLSGGQSCTTAVANAARKIAIDSSGTIYAVMTCGPKAEIAVSTNRGLTFSPLFALSDALAGGSASISQVAVATGPTGVAYVAMMVSSGEVYLRTTQDAGATWGMPALLGTTSSFSAGLSLQSFNDDVYVGFYGNSGITVASNHTRGSGSFATTDVAMSVVFFDLLFDVGLGTLAVCADTPGFHIRASSDAGVTFSTEVNPPGAEFYSDWAIGNGRIFAVGTSGGSDNQIFVIPTNALSTSTSVAGLQSVSASQTRSIAADTAGNAFVASQLNSGAIQLDRLAFGGTAFDAPRTLAAAGMSPVVAALPGNTGAAVVYTINGTNGTEVWVTVQAY